MTKQFVYDHGNHLDIKPYNIPYYSDRIYLDFYKQNKGGLDFATREENFIGRAKVNSTQNLIYTRGEETVLPNLDIGCIHLFFNRIAPDYYSLYANHSTYFSHAEIVLPEDQANLLTEEEKIIEKIYFTPPNIPTGTEQPNAVKKPGFYYDFRLPEKVNEFKILIYNGDELTHQFNIKLNKN